MALISIGMLIVLALTASASGSDKKCPGASKPKELPNSKVRCTEFAGCQLSCKPRYLFPTGERYVYFSCENKQWVIGDEYTKCIAQCKPPCKNGGQCVRPNYCDCNSTGHKGKSCEIKVICNPECLNDGLCINDMCVCKPGFSGLQCETTTKLCMKDSDCGDNAVCGVGEISSPRKCECPPNYKGNPIIACAKTCLSMEMEPCGSNSICVEGIENNDAVCSCLKGYNQDTDGSCHEDSEVSLSEESNLVRSFNSFVKEIYDNTFAQFFKDMTAHMKSH